MSSGSSEVKYISSPVTGCTNPKCHGMQSLPGEQVSKQLFYKLFVFTKVSTFQNFVTAIAFVIEKYMPDMFHVDTNLMSTSGFEYALYQRDISQPFKHPI